MKVYKTLSITAEAIIISLNINSYVWKHKTIIMISLIGLKQQAFMIGSIAD